MKMRAVAEKLSSFFLKNEIFRRGERIVVGVSGGADSVFLLLLLFYLAEEKELRLRVVHVHHGLRPAADREAVFVQELCSELGIFCRVEKVDAAGFAGQHKIGTEEAGRILRQNAFEGECIRWEQEEGGFPCRIALAHHEEDQAETVLFRLARGTSIRGLGGIRPVFGRMIRPILPLRREEIEETLQSMGRSWCEDESNRETMYTRNRIRNHVIPVLEKEIHGNAGIHLAELAEEAAETDAFLEELAREGEKRCRLDPEAGVQIFSVDELMRQPEILRKRILYHALAEQAGKERDICRIHVEQLIRLCEKNGNGNGEFPWGVQAGKQYGQLIFSGGQFPSSGKASGQYGRIGNYPMSAACYTMKVFSIETGRQGLPADQCTKWFDYDKIQELPEIRSRRPGDRITVTALGQQKKISDLMIDEKVPRMLRDQIVFPVSGEEVLWIPGLRDNMRYFISRETRRILEIKYTETPETIQKEV